MPTTQSENIIMLSKEEAWDYLLESGTASEEELQMATYLLGYSVDTLEKVLDIKTGYKCFSQLDDFEEESEEDQE